MITILHFKPIIPSGIRPQNLKACRVDLEKKKTDPGDNTKAWNGSFENSVSKSSGQSDITTFIMTHFSTLNR